MNKTFLSTIAGAALLLACGGGGGGGSGGFTPLNTGATITLTGVAAKGLMANADVGVYSVNADGTVGSAALATTTTDKNGSYSLTFGATQSLPYVLRVSAKTDGSTTHLDEATGLPMALPAGFVMRLVLVPGATGSITTSANVTPFSEMAVAAAAKTSGGITATSATQALSTVGQLLGFDPAKVKATTVASATSADEQKLAVMLTAVSVLAKNGSLGCTSGTAGDKTRCVVDALGRSTSTASIRLSSSGGGVGDVSAALAGAVSGVLGDSTLSGGVNATTLAVVLANLGCTNNCTASAVATAMADTGITASQCFAAGSTVLVSCTSAAAIALNSKQDGMVGRDVGSPDPTDGKLGFSYSAANGGCVKDNVTGLIWEVKTVGVGGLRDQYNTYTNYGDGSAGDASAYVTAINAVGLCGFNDWRLPTVDELLSIVDYSGPIGSPTLDVSWFPDAPRIFLSSSPYANDAKSDWAVYRDVRVSLRSYPKSVRLVR